MPVRARRAGGPQYGAPAGDDADAGDTSRHVLEPGFADELGKRGYRWLQDHQFERCARRFPRGWVIPVR